MHTWEDGSVSSIHTALHAIVDSHAVWYTQLYILRMPDTALSTMRFFTMFYLLTFWLTPGVCGVFL